MSDTIPTPECEAVHLHAFGDKEWVELEFAMNLEKRLAVATEALNKIANCDSKSMEDRSWNRGVMASLALRRIAELKGTK